MTTNDIEFLISDNYLAFLILGGLFAIMYAYREVKLPATRTFVFIAFALLIMCVSDVIESWAAMSPDRLSLRIGSSVIHYIIQPLIIYLELIVLLPPSGNKKTIIIYSIPIAINTLIYLIAPFSGELVFWYDGDYLFHRGTFGISIYIVTFIYLALLIYWSYKSFHENNKRLSMVLLFMASIAILSGTLEAFNLVSGYIDETFAFAVFFFYMYLSTVHESEIRAALINKELELSQQELTLLRQQIRPHFIFNSLHIIKSLIRKDPTKAVANLVDFSEYLRANLDIINSEGLVSFDEELTNIKAYVSLAMADESKGIQIVYDINEHYFRLPPLSIEPLVENSIKHGLTNGGTITLSTKSEGDFYVVTIADDGHGFNPNETSEAKRRRGIGLANSKARIEKLCNGTLDVQSDENGTIVTVRIPKTEGDEN